MANLLTFQSNTENIWRPKSSIFRVISQESAVTHLSSPLICDFIYTLTLIHFESEKFLFNCLSNHQSTCC